MRKTLLSCLLLLCTASAGSIENLPSMGDGTELGLTSAQEREIGEGAMREIRRSGDLVEDPEIVAYLNRLGARLVEASRTTDIRFNFFPIQDKSVNAFALPGGYVGVHTGLIMMTQHESELASVLAHEIAHVTQRHISRMIDGTRANPLITLASIGVAILAAQAGSVNGALSAMTLGSGFNAQRELNFIYAFEQEADRIGMQTLADARFDPHAMPGFFERLHKHNRLEESNAPEFLRTHPVTVKRIADAQGRLNDQPYRQAPDSADYLFVREKVRGMQLKADAAVDYYRKSLQEKRYVNEAAHRYGLANALFMNREYSAAWLELQAAKKTFGGNGHPALEFLAGSILLAQGKNEEAIAGFKKATGVFPSSRALAYGWIDAMIAARQYDNALLQIADYQLLYAGDAQFYQRMAKTYNLQGKLMQAHKAQAEYHVRQQEYEQAIEQLQFALKQPGSDFYLISSIEARLRELSAKTGTSNHFKQGE